MGPLNTPNFPAGLDALDFDGYVLSRIVLLEAEEFFSPLRQPPRLSHGRRESLLLPDRLDLCPVLRLQRLNRCEVETLLPHRLPALRRDGLRSGRSLGSTPLSGPPGREWPVCALQESELRPQLCDPLSDTARGPTVYPVG